MKLYLPNLKTLPKVIPRLKGIILMHIDFIFINKTYLTRTHIILYILQTSLTQFKNKNNPFSPEYGSIVHISCFKITYIHPSTGLFKRILLFLLDSYYITFPLYKNLYFSQIKPSFNELYSEDILHQEVQFTGLYCTFYVVHS